MQWLVSDGYQMPGHIANHSFFQDTPSWLCTCAGPFYALHTCVQLLFPPASLRHAPVTDLASLVTMHGHPLRGRVPSCFPSLLFSYTCKNKMLLCPGKLQPEERNVSQPKNTDCWKKMILEMVLTSMTGSWIRVRKPVLQ